MEVGSGGHGGLGGGLEGGPAGGGGGGGDGMQEVMVAAARDRAVRAGSVRQDLALDLPPRLQLPDGEERPYGAHTALHLRDPEQVNTPQNNNRDSFPSFPLLLSSLPCDPARPSTSPLAFFIISLPFISI